VPVPASWEVWSGAIWYNPVGMRSRTLQEPPVERREYQDNPDVRYQPFPELMPEEQDVYADHDGYKREHVHHGSCLSSHRFLLLCVAVVEQEQR
jgi:hypothetical protein